MLASDPECFSHYISQIGMIGLGSFSSLQTDQLRYYFILRRQLHLCQSGGFSMSIVPQRQRGVLVTMEKHKGRKAGENPSLYFIVTLRCNSFAPDITLNVPVPHPWCFLRVMFPRDLWRLTSRCDCSTG